MGKKITNQKYSKEFKLEALRMFENSDMTVTQVAEELGIPRHALYRWISQHGENPGTAFPGRGKRKSQGPEEDEIYRLRKELADVRMERDILKKAVAIFSKGPRKTSGS